MSHIIVMLVVGLALGIVIGSQAMGIVNRAQRDQLRYERDLWRSRFVYFGQHLRHCVESSAHGVAGCTCDFGALRRSVGREWDSGITLGEITGNTAARWMASDAIEAEARRTHAIEMAQYLRRGVIVTRGVTVQDSAIASERLRRGDLVALDGSGRLRRALTDDGVDPDHDRDDAEAHGLDTMGDA